jgi:hypothetical protein
MNRGHRGSALFREDADRQRFLGMLAELPERFGVELHAFLGVSATPVQIPEPRDRRLWGRVLLRVRTKNQSLSSK